MELYNVLKSLNVDELKTVKKIATELINYLKEYCLNNGINTINLEVREDNFSAISLYEKNGFKLQGVRKNYYDCKDALIYWYYIND